jgi:RNA polymerase sigma factor (sigma-70 family)
MLMAGQEIAKKYASNILNIDEADAAQEVNLYLLESIRKYDPDYRTPKGQRVKLCTYAYGRAENLLKEWILSSSRLVRVPRSKMERILIIVKAYDNLIRYDTNLFALTVESNRILKERKGKLTKANTFNIDEVDGLIKILTSNYIHLDQPYGNHNKSNQVTIGELLSKKGPSVIDKIEDKANRRKLFDLMKKTLTRLEYRVLILRYFHNPKEKVPKALSEVGTLLASVYGGKNYSRESIRKIEKVALKKLKDVKEVQELW